MKIKNIVLCLFLMLLPAICLGQDFVLKKVSGDKQLAVRGTEIKDNLVVCLTDKNNAPVPNVKVNFIVADGYFLANKKSNNNSVQEETLITDENGFAKSKIFIDKKAEDKVVVIVNVDVLAEPVYFTISVLSKHWILLMIATLLGGAALLLFGMFKVNSAFQQIAGQNIRAILTKFTSTRFYRFYCYGNKSVQYRNITITNNTYKCRCYDFFSSNGCNNRGFCRFYSYGTTCCF